MGKVKTKSAVTVEFGPPPEDRRDYHWAEVAEQLRSRPGDWAVVHRDLPSSVVWSRNAGRVSPVHPELGFEARAAKGYDHVGSDGKTRRYTGELWMRYSPEKDTSKTKVNGAKK